MSALTIIGLCLAGCAAIFGAFEVFVGSGRAKFVDLTRPSDYLCQVTRKPRNDLAAEAYLARCEARNVPRIRPLPESDN